MATTISISPFSSMKKELYFVGLFILVLWLVLIVDAAIPADLSNWGVYPRSLRGLVGIPLMPFLHGGFYHLLGNSVTLAILMFLLVGLKKNHWAIVAAIVLINGALVWGLARGENAAGELTNHVGASGLIFGLMGFLILNGFLEKRVVSIGIALLVGFLFGGTMISGIIPRTNSQVSWEGHLFGVVAGAAVAYFLSEKKKLLFWR